MTIPLLPFGPPLRPKHIQHIEDIEGITFGMRSTAQRQSLKSVAPKIIRLHNSMHSYALRLRTKNRVTQQT